MAAYDNPGPEGGASAPSKRSGSFHLSPDMLPPGMADQVNVGDILEFKVLAKPDGEGDVEVEYNYGDEGGGAGEAGAELAQGGEGGTEGGANWEDEFRKEMSPQAPQEEAY